MYCEHLSYISVIIYWEHNMHNVNKKNVFSALLLIFSAKTFNSMIYHFNTKETVEWFIVLQRNHFNKNEIRKKNLDIVMKHYLKTLLTSKLCSYYSFDNRHVNCTCFIKDVSWYMISYIQYSMFNYDFEDNKAFGYNNNLSVENIILCWQYK